MKYNKIDENLIEVECSNFILAETLDCGQAFRWTLGENNHWQGVAMNKFLEVYEENSKVYFKCSQEDFEKIWIEYFDLNRDYQKIIDVFSADETLANATSFCPGIRLLKQDPWETICSFIISQNNNIPRIKGIISRLCENFGEDLGNGNFSFPTAEKIATLTIDDLSIIRSGFRAKYIIDGASKIAQQIVQVEKIPTLNTADSEKELIKIYGVGAKVAQCVLLFAFRKLDAFPIDVWVKKILSQLYPQGLPEFTNEFKGVAQQYLFHYVRYNPQVLNNIE